MCFKVRLPNLNIPGGTWQDTMGYNIFSTVRLRIGDALIQSHPSLWMDIEDKLFCPDEKIRGLDHIVKRGKRLATDETHDLIIPLKFFCCYRTLSKQQFIPILNLDTNMNVYLDFALKPLNLLVSGPPGAELPDTTLNASVLVEYVFLDETERYRFAQSPSTYMFEQVYEIDGNSYLTTTDGQIVHSNKVYIQLRELNKPTKYMAIVAQVYDDYNTFTYYDIVQKGTLYLNSDQQFEPRSREYFQLIQPYQHFTRCTTASNVLAFSFSLDASSFQPCGKLNFAPYVRTQFAFDILPQNVPMKMKIFAVCINWVKFESGLCSLRFN